MLLLSWQLRHWEHGAWWRSVRWEADESVNSTICVARESILTSPSSSRAKPFSSLLSLQSYYPLLARGQP